MRDATIPRPDLPPWLPMLTPRDGHHAAFRTMLHTPTGCKLCLLWFAGLREFGATGGAEDGWFEWHLIHPRGLRGMVATGADEVAATPADFIERADAAVRDLVLMADDITFGG